MAGSGHAVLPPTQPGRSVCSWPRRPRVGRLPLMATLIGIAQASRTILRAEAPRMTARVSRGQLISRGAKGGAALLLTGSLAGSLVDSAAAADTVPDGDLAYARLLVGAELLGLDFYARAIASKRLRGDALGSLKRARLNEREHYNKMSGILTGAGQTPAVAVGLRLLLSKGSVRLEVVDREARRQAGGRRSWAHISVPSRACRRMRSSSRWRGSRRARPST